MAVYKSITFDNRKKIAALYAKGMSISDISDEVGVALRTLYVELKRGATGKLDQNQRPAYDPVLAQRTYQENIRRRGSGPKRKEVKDETASVAAQVKEEKEKQQEFEARREYYTSDAYIEQIAREQLGMVKSNEILYINRGE